MGEGPTTRPLGTASLLALGINGIVGVGIFFAPASVAAELPGPGGAIAYALTALALLPIAVAYAVLGNRFSVDGGPTVWAEAAVGPRFAFFVGWLTFVSSLFSLAAVASGLAQASAPAFGIESAGGIRVFAVLCILVLAFVVSFGLRLSAVAWTAITILKLIPLLFLVAIGTAALGHALGPSAAVPAAVLLAPAATSHSLGRAVLVVVFACQGFEIVPLLAGSVRRSSVAVPIATVGSLVLAAFLYVALHALAARALPGLAASKNPLADTAGAYGGSGARAIVVAGASISGLGILFGMTNTTPRYLSALSGPRAFGPAIGKLDARLVPRRALVITAGAIIVLVLGSSGLTPLFVLSSLAVLAQFSAALVSLAILAHRRAASLTPRYALIVYASVPGILLALRGAKAEEVVVAAGVVLAGEALRRAHGALAPIS
jgi:amino acid transporter